MKPILHLSTANSLLSRNIQGKKYWVEAKMKSIVGLMGKNEKDGGSDHDPISQLIPHLNKALAKPASDERLIFIDLNAEPVFDKNNKPLWHDKAIERLENMKQENLSPVLKPMFL